MRTFTVLSAVCLLLGSLALSPSYGAAGNKKDNESVESILASVPVAELPAKAAELVTNAKKNDREDVALAAVRYTGNNRPGSITPVVSSVIGALPASAPVLAVEAVKLVPTETTAISQAAISAAPQMTDEITRALAALNTGSPGNQPPTGGNTGPGNRPPVPPGLADGTKKGSIRGNRPETPPGHVRAPKPGRDPHRRRYGSP